MNRAKLSLGRCRRLGVALQLGPDNYGRPLEAQAIHAEIPGVAGHCGPGGDPGPHWLWLYLGVAYRPISFRPQRVEPETGLARARRFMEQMRERRSIRMFSSEPVPRETIELAIQTAGTAPSGANKQPWHFVAISDPDLKRQIRNRAELEEREFYESKAPKEWLEALAPLGTDFVKSHLTDAPWLIVVFRRDYDVMPDGSRQKNYYMTESVGIAVGFLIAALHQAGLYTLTHTPAPMTFLREVCGRPTNEKPFVLLPVGYPASDCVIPDIGKKPLSEIAEFR